MTANSCTNTVDGFGFSQKKIDEAAARKGLLSMEVEFSLACNFKCPYCYNERQTGKNELSDEQMDDAIAQAKDLGAEKIIILGGEPMIYPSIHDRIRFIHNLGLRIEMFTNGSHMSMENARFMFDHEVAVVLKMNSRKKELQNRMAGRDDAYDIINAALKNLRKAGYPTPGRRLAVSTVISEQNIEELPSLWRWLRNRDIEPYFEMITPQGNALQERDLSAERQRELFEELARIDRKYFGRRWIPQPPLAGNSCLRHRFSCLVTATGDVMPCVGVTIPIGNVRESRLRDILERSEVMQNLRDYQAHIKGPCAECENAAGCYGCRGAAYQLTGDYMASDPLCWHNRDKKVEKLPAEAAPYLPHRPPMLLIDKICAVGERTGQISARVEKNNPFVKENGFLDETAYAEIVAQALAALEGFNMTPGERSRHSGVLLSIKNFSITGEARAGDTLQIELEKLGKFGDFGAAFGTVLKNGEKIAGGDLTFYNPGGNDS